MSNRDRVRIAPCSELDASYRALRFANPLANAPADAPANASANALAEPLSEPPSDVEHAQNSFFRVNFRSSLSRIVAQSQRKKHAWVRALNNKTLQKQRSREIFRAMRGNSIMACPLLIAVTAVFVAVFLQLLVYSCLNDASCYAPREENSNFGPRSLTISKLGGCNVNRLRAGEHLPLYWAMLLHAGWLHIVLNLLGIVPALFSIESVYGTGRSLLVLLTAGLTGNLAAASLQPCSTIVGASGGAYGLLSAYIVLQLEFYRQLRHPLIIAALVLVFCVISVLSTLDPTTASWAHIFGFTGGLCATLATVTQFEAFGISAPRSRARSSGLTHGCAAYVFWLVPRHWTFGLLLLRLLGVVGAIAPIVYFYRQIYFDFEHGHSLVLSWKPVEPCCCCYTQANARTRENFKCAPCALQFDSNAETFEELCARVNAPPKTMFAAAPFERAPLDDAAWTRALRLAR